MVEFALVAPLFFVLLFGLIVGAIVSMNVVQLNNVVRDGARIAGLCGSGADSSVTIPENPSGYQTCSTANVEYFIVHHLQALPGNTITFTVNVTTDAGGACGAASCSDLSDCSQGEVITIAGTYPQPMYIPLISRLLSNNSRNDGTRDMTATAQAVCAQ